jgi:factor associated with neutral sphingomyelinase activation
LYFQPALGIISVETTPKAISWSLSKSLVATARRYHGLKDAGLELYWKDGTSILFAFERKHEREQVLRLLPTVGAGGVPVPCHTDRDFILLAFEEWQKGGLSNYEYLLLLNSAAGRTFQDLSRYPVFPWVIADYHSPKLDLSKEETYRDLSKPMGALNPKRLEYFKTRYESMADDMDDAFLYGTHYSAAGYVLYYLVRSMPEHMLCLQNGKFDAPDRMFHSIYHTHSCALSNHADVKELIPEFFYNPKAGGTGTTFDFLINVRGLQLGATQNGDRVNDVTLPPWAKSPRDFLRKNAKALESDICTSMLPRWIDLIFGSKSRGEAAKEADNLFHKSAYLGPADLSAMQTPIERFQAELQATEFGIVPDQIFVGPHPLKHETVDESFVNPDVGGRIAFSGTEDGGKADAWELLEIGSDDRPQAEEDLETQNDWGKSSDPVVSDPAVTVDQQFEQHHLDSVTSFVGQETNGRKQQISIPMSGSGEMQPKTTRGSTFSFLGMEPTLSNVSACSETQNQAASQLSPVTPSSPARPMQPTSAEWDIKFIEKGQVHDDTVSGCAMLPMDRDRSLLVTTSLDGGLKVQTLDLSSSISDKKQPEGALDAVGGITSTLSRYMNRQISTVEKSKLSEYRSHTSRDPLACLSVAMDNHGGKVAFVGGNDDVVFAYGINSAAAVASVYSHRDAVTGLDMLHRPAVTPQSAVWSKNSTHIMVSGSWDATIKVWSVVVASGETVSIDREPLAELFDADSPIVCVSAATVPDDGGIVVAAGSADGSFCVWFLHSDGVQVVIHKEPAKRGAGPCSVIKWSSEGGKLTLFTGFNTGKVASYSLIDGSMRRASVASVGVSVQSLEYAEGILLIGCSDGGLRLIPIRDYAYFTQDLSLWPNVNNPNSPGLSSLNISFCDGKCICCSGGEDGTISVFELKRALR